MHSRSPGTAVVHTISASPSVCTHDEAVSVWRPRCLCSWSSCELHWILLEAGSCEKSTQNQSLRTLEVDASECRQGGSHSVF